MEACLVEYPKLVWPMRQDLLRQEINRNKMAKSTRILNNFFPLNIFMRMLCLHRTITGSSQVTWLANATLTFRLNRCDTNCHRTIIIHRCRLLSNVPAAHYLDLSIDISSHEDKCSAVIRLLLRMSADVSLCVSSH